MQVANDDTAALCALAKGYMSLQERFEAKLGPQVGSVQKNWQLRYPALTAGVFHRNITETLVDTAISLATTETCLWRKQLSSERASCFAELF